MRSAYEKQGRLVTHGQDDFFDLTFHQEKLKFKDPLVLPLGETDELLVQLTEFDLGRFLLRNQGLNGYWTTYLILRGLGRSTLHPLEEWILKKAPTVLATRARFFIFESELQKLLKSNQTIASIPCGLCEDLLRLDYNGLSCIQLVGIDADPESLTFAAGSASRRGFDNVTFIERNAWDLGIGGAYDIITSNGLNIYVAEKQKRQTLYQQLYGALKAGGHLVTSFLTPPPFLSKDSPWVDVNPDDLKKQQAIFNDILEVQWQNTQTEDEAKAEYEAAGFKVCHITYDPSRLFPTIVLTKE